MLRTVLLFVVTAIAEIGGCYLADLTVRRGSTPWLLVPAALSLAAFAWLLTLHPSAAGRTYAAYGGVYVGSALLWLWLVEGQTPSRSDILGALVASVGMAIIAGGARGPRPYAQPEQRDPAASVDPARTKGSSAETGQVTARGYDPPEAGPPTA